MSKIGEKGQNVVEPVKSLRPIPSGQTISDMYKSLSGPSTCEDNVSEALHEEKVDVISDFVNCEDLANGDESSTMANLLEVSVSRRSITKSKAQKESAVQVKTSGKRVVPPTDKKVKAKIVTRSVAKVINDLEPPIVSAVLDVPSRIEQKLLSQNTVDERNDKEVVESQGYFSTPNPFCALGGEDPEADDKNMEAVTHELSSGSELIGGVQLPAEDGIGNSKGDSGRMSPSWKTSYDSTSYTAEEIAASYPKEVRMMSSKTNMDSPKSEEERRAESIGFVNVANIRDLEYPFIVPVPTPARVHFGEDHTQPSLSLTSDEAEVEASGTEVDQHGEQREPDALEEMKEYDAHVSSGRGTSSLMRLPSYSSPKDLGFPVNPEYNQISGYMKGALTARPHNIPDEAVGDSLQSCSTGRLEERSSKRKHSDPSVYDTTLLLSLKVQNDPNSSQATKDIVASLLQSLPHPEGSASASLSTLSTTECAFQTQDKVGNPIPLSSGSSSGKYVLLDSALMQQASLAYTESNQLLISRIPADLPLETLLWDIESIGKLMGVTIDLVEFQTRFLAGKGVFQKTGTKSAGFKNSIIVVLTGVRQFHTLGVLRSTMLPLFFFTQPGSLFNCTSKRYTVQALPEGSPMEMSMLREVAAVRGLPDNCHMVTSLFPMILMEVFVKAKSDALLCILSSKSNVRSGPKGGKSFVDEIYIQFFVADMSTMAAVQLSLGCSYAPSAFSTKCWKGQIAASLLSYKESPTNTPELMTNPLVVVITTGVKGDLATDTVQLSRYFPDAMARSSLPSGIGYMRSDIDSPLSQEDATVFLVLFPGVDNDKCCFDITRWNEDHPPRSGSESSAVQQLLPGLRGLLQNYAQNPSTQQAVKQPLRGGNKKGGSGIYLDSPPSFSVSTGPAVKRKKEQQSNIVVQKVQPVLSSIPLSATKGAGKNKRKDARSVALTPVSQLLPTSAALVSAPVASPEQATSREVVTKAQGDASVVMDNQTYQSFMIQQLINSNKSADLDRAANAATAATNAKQFSSLFTLVIDIASDVKNLVNAAPVAISSAEEE